MDDEEEPPEIGEWRTPAWMAEDLMDFYAGTLWSPAWRRRLERELVREYPEEDHAPPAPRGQP